MVIEKGVAVGSNVRWRSPEGFTLAGEVTEIQPGSFVIIEVPDGDHWCLTPRHGGVLSLEATDG